MSFLFLPYESKKTLTPTILEQYHSWNTQATSTVCPLPSWICCQVGFSAVSTFPAPFSLCPSRSRKRIRRWLSPHRTYGSVACTSVTKAVCGRESHIQPKEHRAQSSRTHARSESVLWTLHTDTTCPNSSHVQEEEHPSSSSRSFGRFPSWGRVGTRAATNAVAA
jgi:hypothetical protein